ncbi:MAG: PD40 domain-containing protein, partial [Myxococcales bacterium]|nr:PD40 domain-containing protein [Myxococcales bacterium]
MIGIGYRLAWGVTAFSFLCGSSIFAPTDSVAASKKIKPKLVTVDDYFRLGYVESPRISPDSRWIAYTVTTQNLEADESSSRIWMLPAAGGDPIPLSAVGESSSSPRWSPDGKYLGFLSARKEAKTQTSSPNGETLGSFYAENGDRTQLWTLFREGGEAVQLTNTAQGIQSFAWSPDGKRILLVMQ